MSTSKYIELIPLVIRKLIIRVFIPITASCFINQLSITIPSFIRRSNNNIYIRNYRERCHCADFWTFVNSSFLLTFELKWINTHNPQSWNAGIHYYVLSWIDILYYNCILTFLQLQDNLLHTRVKSYLLQYVYVW